MNKESIRVDNIKVIEVADGLLKYVEQQQKKDLGSAIGPETIHLQVCFKKIPHVSNKSIKIKLPVPLVTDTTDICLFVKDLDKKERDFDPTVRHFKELLEAKGVKNIAEIIPMKQLKLEYQPYEAKRNLSNMFDVYLADDRIFRLLPRQLGKHFLARKRYPQQVNLGEANLKKEIQDVLSQSSLVISGKGSSCMVAVAHSAMTSEQISRNVEKVIETLNNTLPGGPINVRSLVLKTGGSPGLPLYVSLGKSDEVVLIRKPVEVEEVLEDEVTTVRGGRVRITATGRVHVVPTKKEAQAQKEQPQATETVTPTAADECVKPTKMKRTLDTEAETCDKEMPSTKRVKSSPQTDQTKKRKRGKGVVKGK